MICIFQRCLKNTNQMKIQLQNFKCYDDKTFDLGDEGLVLLSAPSGAGKSTILQAIYFALYDEGKKITSFGKKSCKVTLEYEDMKVVRTKGPNRLLVNDLYEDEAGQSIIDKKFGTEFSTTAYVSQNATNSFIMKAPMEKLAFLERFVFQNVDMSSIKKRCKDVITQRNKDLTKTTGKIEYASVELEKMTNPEKVEFPLKCTKNNIEKAIKNENIKYKNSKTHIAKNLKRIKYAENQIAALNILEAKLESSESTLESSEKTLKTLRKKQRSLEFVGDEQLELYEKQLDYIKSNRDFVNILEQCNKELEILEDMKKNEMKELSDSVNEIKENLWSEHNKEEIDETIKDYETLLEDAKKHSTLLRLLKKYDLKVNEKSKEKYEKALETTKLSIENKQNAVESMKTYKCPSCSTRLQLAEGLLTQVDIEVNSDEGRAPEGEGRAPEGDMDTLKRDIKLLKREIISFQKYIATCEHNIKEYNTIKNDLDTLTDSYEDDIPTKEDALEDLTGLQEYKNDEVRKEKRMRKLQDKIDNKTYSSNTESFQRKVDKKKKIVETLKEEIENPPEQQDMEEEELRQEIATQRHNRDRIEEFSEQEDELKKTIKDCEVKIANLQESHIEKYKKIRDVSSVNSLLEKINTELHELEENKSIYESNLEKIEKYNNYETEHDKYISHEKKIAELTVEESEHRRQLAAATLLKETIAEAEGIAVMNIIESINTHSQIYLDSFFQEDPISIRLLAFKETKKGKVVTKKPQINLHIEYKGMEADLHMLSGGEQSRIVLAFALALGEMFNTPIMMLDECTSSLDQELTETVVKSIKGTFNGKLVLIIAHQCITGCYDKIINF